MDIPRYWVSLEETRRVGRRRAKVRRYGWSNESRASAEKHAKQRLSEAFDEWGQGKQIVRIEKSTPYGEEGLPIREEILDEGRDAVVTRNYYGSHCINTPVALFADIDFRPASGLRWLFSFFFLGTLFVTIASCWPWLLAAPTSEFIVHQLAALVVGIVGTGFILVQLGADTEGKVLRRVRWFAKSHPDWGMRVYRTPRGVRILVTHAEFSPKSAETEAFFKAVGSDPVYVQMCKAQDCFRARVTPKPWRIGIKETLPSSGCWPPEAEVIPLRDRWIREYESKSGRYAACRFVTSLGNTTVAPRIRQVQELHDRLCRAQAACPIA